MYARGFSVDAQDNGLGAEYTPWGGSDFNFYRGGKQYELSNHLGNVIVTINDIKLGTAQAANSSLIDHFNAFAIMVSDYYPFGMQIPGRSYNTSLYRYGFNGQEHDDEVNGNGNSYGAEFWEYDPRIGRRWNLDPKPSVGISSYSAFNNNPIFNSDPTGAQPDPGGGDNPFTAFWNRMKQYFTSKITAPTNHNVDRSEDQQVFNSAVDAGVRKMEPVIKMVGQAKTIATSLIPGVTSYQEMKKGNYAMAAVFGVVDLFGGEVLDGAGKLIARVVGRDALSATGKAINTFLKDEGNVSFKGSFEKGRYEILEAHEDITVYRVSGGSSSKEIGQFFSTSAPKSSADAEKMLNINMHGNTGEEITPVTIKKGTQFAYGKVKDGTGFQIFITEKEQAGNVLRHTDKTVSIPPK